MAEKKRKKITTNIDIEHALGSIGPYELKRIEKRTKNGKKEVAGRIVDTGKKKVTEMYRSPKGKKYKLVEELGAVQRRGVNLVPKKGTKKMVVTKKGKLKGQLSERETLPRIKVRLLPTRTKYKGGLMVKPKAAKRGY